MNDIIPFTEAETYQSPACPPGLLARLWPSAAFYLPLLALVGSTGLRARHPSYDGKAWVDSSVSVLRLLERVGCRLEVSGLEHVRQQDGPCVIVGNHMSTLETFVLPCFLQPWRNTTFVVKPSLVRYPFFGAILRSRNPVVVGRSNPREDLATVLREGVQRLEAGTSLIIFPQSTRSATFNPEHFNSMGIKLAKRAGVPVIPLALKSDAWSNGRLIKDVGTIYPERTIHFTFSAPMIIKGSGKDEHRFICDFITEKIRAWSDPSRETEF